MLSSPEGTGSSDSSLRNEDYDTEYGDLVMHSEVRWLSQGKKLERFLSLLPEIHTFLDNKGKKESRAGRPKLDHTAAFLTDITCHLNTLNLKHQGRDKLPSNMLNTIREYKITVLYC